MAGRIEDYALVGDLQTAALIGRDGTIDWLCLPRIDSSAVFAGLLGSADNGFWRIGPTSGPDADASPARADRRNYLGDTLILESEWDTPTGTLRVTDFMPPRTGAPRLVRIVEAVEGTVTATSSLCLRFDYGKVVPWVYKTTDERTRAAAGPDAVWLDTAAETHGAALTTRSDLTLTTGERVAFTLTWQPSYDPTPPDQLDTEQALEDTEKFWSDWVAQCTYSGPHRDAVIRSLITLKALTNPVTGGIVAAPTTSLPEDLGGVRNWDYRYVWLRDAAITMSSLLRAGYRDEARAWRTWLLHAVAGDPENLQIMYGIAGERELPETKLHWLAGYENSRPVRTGNEAAGQRQLDVYGEVIEALYLAAQLGLERDETSNHLLVKLVQSVDAHWREPDKGIWEVRGPDRHFVHSKVMAWVAVDRTIKLIESGHADGPVDQWKRLRATIHQDVCTHGFDRERNTFTQSYGSRELDAALLLIPQVGFLPADDPRVIGTIEAIQKELSTLDGFLLRYPTDGPHTGLDGLPGDEGAFLVCSFWLADALAMIGRDDEAQDLFERLLALRSDLGLLAEEWDPHRQRQRQVGNYPQAFSHIGIVDVALALEHRGSRRPCVVPGGAA